jgi:hypothetical protein
LGDRRPQRVLCGEEQVETKMSKNAKQAKPDDASNKRSDGRKALLVYLKPEVTLNLKRAALEAGQPAYELAEEAIKEWLKRPKK